MYRHRERHQQMDQEPLDRWLVSYADYVTLMFALFVVLYSLAIAKEEKFKTISTTLSQVFEKPPVPETGVKGPDVLTDNKPRSDYQKFGSSLETATGPELVADAKEQTTQQDPKFGNPLVSLQEQLTQSLANLIEQGVAKVENDDDWLTIQLNSGLLFPSGSAVQTSSAEILLKEIVGILNQTVNIVRVRGYTDNQAMSNEIFPSNWELSMARATAILRELQRLGVRPERLAAEGYGEFAPFADNSSEAGRAENRKVVIAISKFAARPLKSQQQVPAEATPEQVQQFLRQAAQSPAEDGTIHVIRLPHGGIRITAAPEAATDNTEQKNGNN